MNVGAYIRVSTVFEEQDTSVINQEEGLNDYIRRNGWILFDTYKTSFRGGRLGKQKGIPICLRISCIVAIVVRVCTT